MAEYTVSDIPTNVKYHMVVLGVPMHPVQAAGGKGKKVEEKKSSQQVL